MAFASASYAPLVPWNIRLTQVALAFMLGTSQCHIEIMTVFTGLHIDIPWSHDIARLLTCLKLTVDFFGFEDLISFL